MARNGGIGTIIRNPVREFPCIACYHLQRVYKSRSPQVADYKVLVDHVRFFYYDENNNLRVVERAKEARNLEISARIKPSGLFIEAEYDRTA